MGTVTVSMLTESYLVRSDSSTPCLEEVYTNEETILVPKLPEYMKPKGEIPQQTKGGKKAINKWISTVIIYPSEGSKKRKRSSDDKQSKKRKC